MLGAYAHLTLTVLGIIKSCFSEYLKHALFMNLIMFNTARDFSLIVVIIRIIINLNL